MGGAGDGENVVIDVRVSIVRVVAVFVLSIAARGWADSPHGLGVRLSPPAEPGALGVEGESSYREYLADAAHALRFRLRRIEQASDSPLAERIELRLAAANWTLAKQCEPPLSRRLLGMGDPSDSGDVGRWITEALNDLQAARRDLSAFEETEGYDEDRAAQFSDSIELLTAFAGALGACMSDAEDEESLAKYGEAARVLSEYLEDDRPQVVAAATLFQGMLYGKTNRVDRALRLLPQPGKPPRREALRYDFFARLLRCKYIAEQGGYAAAWGLLLSLEEPVEDWFITATGRTEARRAAMLVKFDICRDWSEVGEASSRQATRAWCDKALERIRAEYFPAEGDHALMRLITAVPMIARPPKAPGSAGGQ